MNNDILIKEVELDRSNRKADGSVSITLITSKEQSSEEFIEIDKLRKTSGVMVYKSSGQISQKEIDEIAKAEIDVEGKTLSEKLHNALYGAWARAKELGETEKTFDKFYIDYKLKEIDKAKEAFK